MNEPTDRRTYDTPGRRLTDQAQPVVIDAFTNGAHRTVRRIWQVLIACLVAFLLAVPGGIWSAGRWTTSVEDAMQAVAVRDSVMLAAIIRVEQEVVEHRVMDDERTQAMSEAIQETSVTMAGVVAVQRDLQEEVRRLRDQ